MKLTKATLRSLISEVAQERRKGSMLLSEQMDDAPVDLEKENPVKDSYDEIIDILEGQNPEIQTVGIMSGQNPMAQKTSPADNSRLDYELKEELKTMQLQFIPIGGMFGHPEDSVLILNPLPKQLHDLNRKFNQWGYVWGYNLPTFKMMQVDYDKATGVKMDPNSKIANQVVKHEQAQEAQDNYSFDIKTGKKFIIPLY